MSTFSFKYMEKTRMLFSLSQAELSAGRYNMTIFIIFWEKVTVLGC